MYAVKIGGRWSFRRGAAPEVFDLLITLTPQQYYGLIRGTMTIDAAGVIT